MKHKRALVLLFVVSIFSLDSFAKELFYYGGDQTTYNYQILAQALSYHKDVEYRLTHYPVHMPKDRAYNYLATNNQMDIVFGGATLEREKLNRPIRIPLLKGLNGWRVPLIHKSSPRLMANKQSIDEFKQLVAGQFHMWSDVAILEHNKVKVHKLTNLAGIYEMLHKNRFDYFPRSVLEVWHDYERNKHLDISIEQHTLIYYPTAYYFYVNKDNDQLAQIVEAGLEAAIKDGSFDKIFNQHFGETIAKITLNPRRVFRLQNPYLSPSTPLLREEFWIDLGARVDKGAGSLKIGAAYKRNDSKCMRAGCLAVKKTDSLIAL